MDWSEPLPLESPTEDLLPVRGQASQEKHVQEEREKTALGALYMSPAHIPDSPVEPANVIPEESVDKNARTMTCGPEVESAFWSSPSPVSVNRTVADLVGQLTASNATLMGQTTNSLDLKAVGLDPNAVAALQNLPPEQLQYFQQLAQQHQGTQQQQGLYDQGTRYTDLDRDWNASQHPEYDHGYGDDRDRRWADDKERGHGRGRGRGRGDDGGIRNNKRKPCSFFAVGRCKYGDQCDFSHESSGGSLY